MLRVLRSLCQETGDVDLRSNLGLVTSRQFTFENPQFDRLFDIIKKFSRDHSGNLPSIVTVVDESKRIYGTDSAEYKLASELSRIPARSGSDFTHLLGKVIEDQAVNRLNNDVQKELKNVEILRSKYDIKEVINRVTGNISSKLLHARSSVSENDVKTGGLITDPDEMKEYLKQFQDEIKDSEPKIGLLTGYTAIDYHSYGFRPGELVLIAGYTGELKSTTCRNIIYNSAIMNGVNSIYYSCEIGFASARDQFIVLHSTHPKWDRPPLDSKRVKARTFSQEEAQFFADVALDLAENPEYGDIQVEQPKDRPFKWSEIVMMSEILDSQIKHGIDMVCLDYYDWIEWDGPSRDDSAVNEMIKASKQMAMNFRNGHGVVFMSPFQMNNDGYAYAIKHSGEYNLSHLSTHNQSRRSADYVISVFLGPDGSQFRKANQVKICNLKNRDNDPFPPLILQTMLSSGRIFNSTLSLTDEDQSTDEGAEISASEIASNELNKVLDSL